MDRACGDGLTGSPGPAAPPRPPCAGAPRRFAAATVPADLGAKGAVCRRGHALEAAVLEGEEFGGPCPECGAEAITGCPRCGLRFGTGAERAEAGPACARCGEPFPWSAGARRAGRAAALKILGAAAAGATIIAVAVSLISSLG